MHPTIMSGESSHRTSFPRLRSVQAAAICYRMGKRDIEFLLVQTGGGRWTFPKGNIEPGLSHAQAAGMEAFEEAGVHGRIEEVSFARYFYTKRVRTPAANSAKQKLSVSAHLCEVLRIEAAQEPGRNPSWFAAGRTKQRLREGRTRADAAELIRVVDRALARIHDLQSMAARITATRKDALQEVSFEAAEIAGSLREAAFLRFMSRSRQERRRMAAAELTPQVYLDQMLRLEAGRSDSVTRGSESEQSKSSSNGKSSPRKPLPN